MERNPELRLTADGSPTLYLPDFDETYHSRHGSIQESMHVFIEAGLKNCPAEFKPLEILEIGFGSGLNALLTYQTARNASGREIAYSALEPFPLKPQLAKSFLNQLPEDLQLEWESFERMHALDEGEVRLSDHFLLRRFRSGLADFVTDRKYHLIYFDAFAPRVQPDLWTEATFRRLSSMMEEGGKWVSYCAKGSVRRALQSSGFFCERLPGPKGKREMLRATKKN